jgi:hypothetical protein
MKPRSTPPAITAFLSALAIILCGSCGGGGSSAPKTYPNAAISISPQTVSIPVNDTQTFTANVANDSYTPTWLLKGSDVSSSTGAINTTSGPTITYTAPAAPPLYGSVATSAGVVQGTVTILAEVTTNPANFSDLVNTQITFVITGPISVGVSPATASVHVGGTQQFTGYAVGSTNNAITWQVNGVSGGGTATGTINAMGLYTAPATLPMTGNTVTITAVSQADQTKSASSAVTLASP